MAVPGDVPLSPYSVCSTLCWHQILAPHLWPRAQCLWPGWEDLQKAKAYVSLLFHHRWPTITITFINRESSYHTPDPGGMSDKRSSFCCMSGRPLSSWSACVCPDTSGKLWRGGHISANRTTELASCFEFGVFCWGTMEKIKKKVKGKTKKVPCILCHTSPWSVRKGEQMV